MNLDKCETPFEFASRAGYNTVVVNKVMHKAFFREQPDVSLFTDRLGVWKVPKTFAELNLDNFEWGTIASPLKDSSNYHGVKLMMDFVALDEASLELAFYSIGLTSCHFL